MVDTSERIREVKQRVREKRRIREKRSIGKLSAVSITLFILLLQAFGQFAEESRGAVQGFSGSTMMLGDAGGYVLVGVASFAAAVVITVLCIRYRKKEKKDHKAREDETK